MGDAQQAARSEVCAACGDGTGRAGYGEDSIGYVDGMVGPLCGRCDARLRLEVEADSALRAEVERLRRALAPFAAAGAKLPEEWPGDKVPFAGKAESGELRWNYYLAATGAFPTVADFRAAAREEAGRAVQG